MTRTKCDLGGFRVRVRIRVRVGCGGGCHQHHQQIGDDGEDNEAEAKYKGRCHDDYDYDYDGDGDGAGWMRIEQQLLIGFCIRNGLYIIGSYQVPVICSIQEYYRMDGQTNTKLEEPVTNLFGLCSIVRRTDPYCYCLPLISLSLSLPNTGFSIHSSLYSCVIGEGFRFVYCFGYF